MSLTKQEGMSLAEAASGSYAEQRDELQRKHDEICASKKEVSEKLDKLFHDLAIGLLSRPDRATIEAASDELGFLSLPANLSRLEAAQRDNQGRLKEIEGAEGYRDRELLIHPRTGEYTTKVRELSSSRDALNQAVQRFESHTDFMALHEVKDAPELPRWRLLARRTRERRRASVFANLGGSDLASHFQQYEETRASLGTLYREVQHYDGLRSEIEGLVEEYRQRSVEVDEFEARSLDTLRSDVVAHLTSCEGFGEIRERVREGARITVTSIVVLKEKLTYLSNMGDFLSREIRDREGRIEKIDGVRHKWQRSSKHHIQGDKTKWLVETPAQKASSTTKQVAWIDSMHGTIDSYDDYSTCDRILSIHTDVLWYDVFARAGGNQMPYEGFSSQVIPGIAEYREAHGSEGPEYGEIDSALDASPDGSGDAAAAAMAAAVTIEMLDNDEAMLESDSEAFADIS